MGDNHICHVCGNNMYHCVEDREYHYNGKSVIAPDVELFKCDECGEAILTSQEAKRVEEIVLAEVAKKKN